MAEALAAGVVIAGVLAGANYLKNWAGFGTEPPAGGAWAGSVGAAVGPALAPAPPADVPGWVSGYAPPVPGPATGLPAGAPGSAKVHKPFGSPFGPPVSIAKAGSKSAAGVPMSAKKGPKPSVGPSGSLPAPVVKPVDPIVGSVFQSLNVADPDLVDKIEQALRIPMTFDMLTIMDDYHSAHPDGYKFIIAGGRAFEYIISPALQSKLSQTEYNHKKLYLQSFDFDIYVHPPASYDSERDATYDPTYWLAFGYSLEDYNFFRYGGARINAYTFPPFVTLFNGLNNYYKPTAGDPFKEILRKRIVDALRVIDPLSRVIDLAKVNEDLLAGRLFVKEFFVMRRKPMWRIKMRIPLVVPDPASKPSAMYKDIELIDLKNIVQDVRRDSAGRLLIIKDKSGEEKYQLRRPENTFISPRTFPNINGRYTFATCTIPVYIASPHDNENITRWKEIYAMHPTIMVEDNGWLVGDRAFGTGMLAKWADEGKFNGDFNSLLATILSVFGFQKELRNLNLPFVIDHSARGEYLVSERHIKKYVKRLIRCVSLMIFTSHFPAGSNPFPSRLTKTLGFHSLFSYFNLNLMPQRLWIDRFNLLRPCIIMNGGNSYKFMYEGLDKSSIVGILNKRRAAPNHIDPSTSAIQLNCGLPPNGRLVDWDKWQIVGNAYGRNMRYYTYWNRDPNVLNPNGPLEFRDVASGAYSKSPAEPTYFETAIKWTEPDPRRIGLARRPGHWAGWTHLWEVDNYLSSLIEGAMGYNRSRFMNHIERNGAMMDKSGQISSWLYYLYWYSYNAPLVVHPQPFFRFSKADETFTAWRYSFPLSFIWQDSNNNFKRGLVEEAPVGSTVYSMKPLSATMQALHTASPEFAGLGGPKHAMMEGYSLYKIKSRGKGCLFINKASNYNEQELLILPWSAFRIVSKSWKFLQHLNVLKPENINQYRRVFVVEFEQVDETYADLFKAFPKPSAAPKHSAAASAVVAIAHKSAVAAPKSSAAVAIAPKSAVAAPKSSAAAPAAAAIAHKSAVAAPAVAATAHKSAAAAPKPSAAIVAPLSAVAAPAGPLPCPPPADTFIPATIGHINTFVNNNSTAAERGANDRLDKIGTILERASGRNRFALPEALVGKPVIDAIGDGTCAVHAFLIATSSLYRKLIDDEVRGRVGIDFRRTALQPRESLTQEQICNPLFFLYDTHLTILANRFGYNALIISHFCDISSGIYQDPSIAAIDRTVGSKILENSPWIVFEHVNANHYNIVNVGTPIIDGDNRTSSFTIRYEDGLAYYQAYNQDALLGDGRWGADNPNENKVCNQPAYLKAAAASAKAKTKKNTKKSAANSTLKVSNAAKKAYDATVALAATGGPSASPFAFSLPGVKPSKTPFTNAIKTAQAKPGAFLLAKPSPSGPVATGLAAAAAAAAGGSGPAGVVVAVPISYEPASISTSAALSLQAGDPHTKIQQAVANPSLIGRVGLFAESVDVRQLIRKLETKLNIMINFAKAHQEDLRILLANPRNFYTPNADLRAPLEAFYNSIVALPATATGLLNLFIELERAILLFDQGLIQRILESIYDLVSKSMTFYDYLSHFVDPTIKFPGLFSSLGVAVGFASNEPLAHKILSTFSSAFGRFVASPQFMDHWAFFCNIDINLKRTRRMLIGTYSWHLYRYVSQLRNTAATIGIDLFAAPEETAMAWPWLYENFAVYTTEEVNWSVDYRRAETETNLYTNDIYAQIGANNV
jgi:hypothetical protein